MPVSAEEFRRALAQFASGVTVVTTRDRDGRPLGLTVSSFCSVSLEPPLVLVSIDNRSEAHEGLREAGVFAASVLAEGQEEVSRRFARSGPEKFAGFTLEPGTLGVGLVPGAVSQVECRVVAAHPAGDHVVYVGEVVATHTAPGRPLVYHRGNYRRLAGYGEGSEP